MNIIGTLTASAVGLGLLAGAAAAQDRHELYSHMPDNALSGVADPYIEDRGDIDKALPKTPRDPKNIVIGWSEITMGNPWFVEVVEAAKRKAAEYGGYTIDVQVADGDPARTSAHFDGFIARGVDVIVVDPTDVVGTATDAQRAVDAGIPVIAIGTVPDATAPVVTTLLANPFEGGFESGRYAADKIGKDTDIVAGVTIGTLGNSTSESRTTGLISGIVQARSDQFGLGLSREDATLQGFKLFQQLKTRGSFNWPEGHFEVVGIQPGGWTEEGGLKGAEDLLAGHRDRINLILAENDFMGIGALTAIENIGRKGQIQVACAADGFRVSLDLIRDGDMLSTGTNSARANGEAVMMLINDIFRNGFDANDLPVGSHFPGAAITRENVDSYIDPDATNPFFKFDVPPVRSIPELRN
ncbi:sugar ABC transporter substrate-binding protein [Sinirhodobacter populi]|uniref:Sugar ABC transporter substrate-binding protein n=1 Tax=Paenirhodobacter populi TaxID=2306993 RepID=A0A443K7I2_9RHOB|nr:sugar ABC transporter substrate-binding protein [Sinirhodobacter populi]RWR28751.1 sugar ABC transporter substrate-binding protein [Sinirhodobacter populi]